MDFAEIEKLEVEDCNTHSRAIVDFSVELSSSARHTFKVWYPIRRGEHQLEFLRYCDTNKPPAKDFRKSMVTRIEALLIGLEEAGCVI